MERVFDFPIDLLQEMQYYLIKEFRTSVLHENGGHTYGKR